MLPRQGMPSLRGGRRGDLHVRLHVAVSDADDRGAASPARGLRPPARDRTPTLSQTTTRVLQQAEERASVTQPSDAPASLDPGAGLSAEIARALLLALAPSGFEELETDGRLELVVYADDDESERRIRAEFENVTSQPVEPGWEDAWRDFHRPVRAGGLWVGPPWETPPPGEPAVVVDPGRAFGTGAHPTTRACIELLARRRRTSVLDAGCGSGVLAVAAVRLGFGPVFARRRRPSRRRGDGSDGRAQRRPRRGLAGRRSHRRRYRRSTSSSPTSSSRRRGAAGAPSSRHGHHVRLPRTRHAVSRRVGAGGAARARRLGGGRSRRDPTCSSKSRRRSLKLGGLHHHRSAAVRVRSAPIRHEIGNRS